MRKIKVSQAKAGIKNARREHGPKLVPAFQQPAQKAVT